MTVQRVPSTGVRPETGAMQFGDDWPGVFVRGDNAMYFARCLAAVLRGDETKIERLMVEELREFLDSCAERGGGL